VIDLPKRISPRETKRLMKRMGLSLDAMPEVHQVTFKTDSKEILIDDPEVAVLDLKGQRVFQVTGGTVTERKLKKDVEEVTIPETDIRLVADQTGRDVEEARAALEESQGDLAKAILLLQTK
jgi:nascent polypeptide-associated complex subunit alpha